MRCRVFVGKNFADREKYVINKQLRSYNPKNHTNHVIEDQNTTIKNVYQEAINETREKLDSKNKP